MSKIQNVSVISFLSFSIIVGSLVFSRGFLLNRQTISEKSSPCYNSNYSKSDSNRTPPFELTIRSLSSAASWCNPSPLFPKMIIILVDALRFDFVGRMKFLSKITSPRDNQNQSGISSCLFKFLADPPTTTMQRLKALMTGTMPTFIDASANFNSYEVEEDSVIHQLYAANKKVAFLGDDTWLSLFPRKLFQSPFVEAFPSFNAWDLDTVDRGVNSSLRKMFSAGNRDEWDVIISHILGVDHCGHRYGPNHPEMVRKLNEADAIVEYVFNAMSHETLLVIFGDHGMTETGDHGGDSQDEVESAAIFLTKQLKRNKQINPPFQCPSKSHRGSNIMSISQVDLAPTLSSMLGVPIPFSNIGQVIPDFLVNKIFSDAVAANVAQIQKYINRYSTVSNIASLGSAIHLQYEKVEEAFMEYQSSRNPSTRAKLHELAQTYLMLMKSIAVTTWTQFDVPMIYTGLFIVILSVISLTVYLSNVPALLKRNGSNYSVLSWLWPSLPVWSVLSSFVTRMNSTTGILGIVVCTLSGIGVFLIILCVKLIKIGIFRREHIRKQKKTHSNCNNEYSTSDLDTSDIGSIIMYAFTCLAVFSNSFVINEGYIIGSVLLSVVLIHIMSSKRPLRQLGIGIESDMNQRNASEDTAIRLPIVVKLFKCSWFCFFMLAFIIRIGHTFFRCREELQECREEFLLHKQLSSLPSDWVVHKYVRYGVALVALAVFVVSFQHWMLYRKCILNSRPCSIIAKFVPSLLVVLLGVFWALQGLPFAGPSALKVKPLLNHFPLVFQTVTIFSLVVIWIKPLCCVGRLRRNSGKCHESQNIIMEKRTNVKAVIDNNHVNVNNVLFSSNNFCNGKVHLNGIASGDQFCKGNVLPLPTKKVQTYKSSNEDSSIIFESGSNECDVPDTLSEDVFSSSLLTFVALVLLLLVQVTSSGMTPSVVMIAYSIVCLVGIYRSSPSHDLSSWSAVVSWVLCSQYFFYATGHQPIFSALPWDSVFIGASDGNSLGTSPDSWLTWLRPALAVLGNLNISQILFSISLPLLTYWKGDSDNVETKMGHQERCKAYIVGGKFILLHAVKLLLCMSCAAWQRRHLMVWKIFAPKFIFEAVSFIVTSSMVMFSLVFVTRIDYLYQKITINTAQASQNCLLPFHKRQPKHLAI